MFRTFLTSILICLLVFSLSQGQAIKDRLDLMNPVARSANLGEILNCTSIALSSEGQCLFDSMKVFTYGTGASDTVKLRIVGETTMYHSGVQLEIADTVKAFTATTHDVTDGSFASFRISVASNRAITLTMSAAEYATLDSARQAVAAIPANEVNLGFVIVGADGALFNATTTKLNVSTVNLYVFPEAGFIGYLE